MSKHDPATCSDPVNCHECSTLAIHILRVPDDLSKPGDPSWLLRCGERLHRLRDRVGDDVHSEGRFRALRVTSEPREL